MLDAPHPLHRMLWSTNATSKNVLRRIQVSLHWYPCTERSHSIDAVPGCYLIQVVTIEWYHLRGDLKAWPNALCSGIWKSPTDSLSSGQLTSCMDIWCHCASPSLDLGFESVSSTWVLTSNTNRPIAIQLGCGGRRLPPRFLQCDLPFPNNSKED